jgi:pyruvate kinase
MDLSGPKLRTGAIEPGPAVIKWSPRRNVAGQEIEPARILLTPASRPARTANAVVVPVEDAWLSTLAPEDKVRLTDLRGRQREMRVIARRDDGVIAESDRTAYVGPETTLYRNDEENGARVAEAPSIEQSIIVCEGDTLILTADGEPGRPARYGADGRVTEPARIPCTLPEVFADVKVGERVLLDDGKIATVIESASATALKLRVTRSAPGGVKLRADKGVNFPDSSLSVKGLTQKDVQDLETVVRLADMVSLSFVSRPGDVADLHRELARLGGAHLGVVLKIETRQALERLPAILLAAMKGPSVGVMIARGDLAVECGFERLAEAQEEILWICEAAHVPVIWATQVLESLAKSGLPSRAEITDAAMSGRAECVMLNKGPYICRAIETLRDILLRMQAHQHKKIARLRALHW